MGIKLHSHPYTLLKCVPLEILLQNVIQRLPKWSSVVTGQWTLLKNGVSWKSLTARTLTAFMPVSPCLGDRRPSFLSFADLSVLV